MLASWCSYAQFEPSEAPVAIIEVEEYSPPCYPTDCTTLNAEYFKIKPTNTYEVKPLTYQNLYSYTGGTVLNITSSDDIWSPVFNLPFKFCFYGQIYDKVIMGSNGVISFDTGAAGGYCPWSFNSAIPNTGFPVKNAIYGVYQDTDMRTPAVVQNPAIQNINYYAGGTAPNRYFVANFNRLPQFSCGGNLGDSDQNPSDTDTGLSTTQIVIYETTNIIDVIVYKRVPCNSWQSGRGVIGLQNAAGTSGIAPPLRNTGNWSVLGTAASPSEAWRFFPNGNDPTPPLVLIEWFDEAGNFIGNGTNVTLPNGDSTNNIEVCPTENQTYTVRATYDRCGQTDTVIVEDTVLVEIADPLVGIDPVDLIFCNDEYPATVNVNQDTYILDGADPFDYEILYFLNLVDAENQADSNQIPTVNGVTNIVINDDDPVTIYSLIRGAFGGVCTNIRPFTVEVGTPKGDFTYPEDATDVDVDTSTFCFNSNSALAPVLDPDDGLTEGGTYTVDPPTGLTIDPTTGVLDLTGAVAGTYTINYDIEENTDPGGCPAFNANTIVIIESCIDATVANSGPFCQGTATFELTTTYTEPPGGATTYEWTDNDGTIVSTVQNPVGVAVPAAAGSYTYSLVITQNGADSEEFTTVLIVHPTPEASFVSSSTTICTNSSTTITFTGTPGAELSFTNGTDTYDVTFDTSGNAEFITPVLANNTTYTLVDVTGNTTPACSATLNASITITVGLPTASIVGFTNSISVICSGTGTGLEIQGTPNAVVSYTKDGVAQTDVILSSTGIFTIPTGDLTVTATTTYTYALTNVESTPTPPAVSCSDTITGETATLTVNALPTASFTAVSTTVCEGTAATLNFTGTPNATVTYNNGTTDLTTILSNSGTSTVTTALLSATTTFTLVSAEVTNTVLCSNTLTGSIIITIDEEPIITTQPVGDTICINGTHTFTVVATGANLTYQWYKNGAGNPIASATNASYTVANATAASAGNYTVVVTGTCGLPVTSSAVTLVITQETIITNQPQASTTVCVGQPLNLSVAATGTDIAYQWFLGTTSLAGETNPSLNIASATTADAGTYTVVITNSCQAVNSANAVVIVNELPAITTQPIGTTICEGEGISLSVTATGTGLTYQWFRNGTIAIPSATSATYADASVSLAEAGNYTVRVSGACTPAVTSSIAVINVNQGVTLAQQPVASTTVCVGQPINLSVTATGTNLTYQWYRGTTSLTGKTNSTLNIASATTADAGTYTVVVTNPCQGVTSGNAVVIVNELPVITVQPIGATICEEQGISLSVTATGTGLTYQWFRNGNLLPVTTATYNDASVTLAEAGNYTVKVSGACAPAVTSAIAVINVNQGATFNSQPVASTIVCSGEPVSLSIATTGGTGVSYQWFKGSTAIAGATGTTYTMSSTVVADSGSYTCVVTVASCGTKTSNAAVVVVNQAPAITTQPQGKEICVGENVTFEVVATGTNLTYQWYKGTTAISGATTSNYTISNTVEADSGNYYCTIKSASCPDINTNVVALLVKPLPFATISQGNPSTICQGQSTQVIFNGTAGAVVIYTINGGTPETITLNANVPTILPTGILDETTVYELVSVTYTGANACSQNLTGSATVTVNPLPSVILEDGFICIDPVTLATTRIYRLDTELNEADFTFAWFDENGPIAGQTYSYYDVDTVGQYGVTITDIVTGCQSSAFANVDSSSPPTDFTYTVSGFFADNPTVVITATPMGDYEYQLDYGPFQESNVFDNISAGQHTITVRDPQACDVLTKSVLIIDYPKYFTPNGDGINDTWTIETIDKISFNKIYIFDRFGKLVKEMTAAGAWDGTYNGQELPATDYWFTINYEEAAVNKEFRAHFSLKR